MAEVNMPRLSDTMEEGMITRWLKQPGDEIKKGDIIAEVETDKANMEVESYDAGTLDEILVKEGETARIGAVIALIGNGAGAKQQTQSASRPEASAAVRSRSASKEKAVESPARKQDEPQRSQELTPVQNNGMNNVAHGQASVQTGQESARLKVSPLARRIAAEHGVDLSQVQGKGPGGRIERADVEDMIEQQRTTQEAPAQPSTSVTAPAAAQQAAPVSAGARPALLPGDEVIAISSMQKTIARRLTEAKQAIPHIYIGNEIDMTEALALRQTLNASAGEDGIKISVNDLVIKACALALEKFPEVNSSYDDGQFIRHKQVNIGMAVDVPNGLVVPVIRDVNIKGVRSIAREAKALVEKARSRRLSTTDLEGGTFSISNLGMMDVTDFSAVINPPQSAIIAVGTTRKTFVPIGNQPVIRDIMHVTVSADHRILYGAGVARFLQEVKRLLQNPYSLLG